MTRTQLAGARKPSREGSARLAHEFPSSASGADRPALAAYPITIGARLRANADLLDMIAQRYGRLGQEGLRSLAAQARQDAADVDALAEAQAWVDAAVRSQDRRSIRLRRAA